jgi:hypothetical protein
LVFNAALNAGLADSTGNYLVTQARGRRIRALPVLFADYDPGSDAVTISVAGFKPNKPAQVTISGLAGANGAGIAPIVSGL